MTESGLSESLRNKSCALKSLPLEGLFISVMKSFGLQFVHQHKNVLIEGVNGGKWQ